MIVVHGKQAAEMMRAALESAAATHGGPEQPCPNDCKFTRASVRSTPSSTSYVCHGCGELKLSRSRRLPGVDGKPESPK